MQASITIERNGEEIEVIVEGTYHSFCAGARDGRHGPPIEPDEPAHFEIDSVQDENGNEIELTDKEYEQAQDALMNAIPDEPDYDDLYD